MLLSRLLVIAFVACAVSQTHAGEKTGSRPNIVWIIAEDMNGWMDCFGDDTVPTPNFDELASKGTVFTRAYMPAPVCSASRSAIATGAMQTSLGIHNHRSSRARVAGEVIRLPAGVKTVYELMRDAGYYVYSNPGKDDFNFAFFRDELYDKVVDLHLGFTGPQWRERPAESPFFAQIQLLGGKNNGNFRTRPGGHGATSPDEIEVPPYYPDIPIIRELVARHYDCIQQTDDEVGHVLEALAEDDLLDNTVVFFWSDHGIELYRHKQWLYEGGIRVPLLIAGPGIIAGTKRQDLVSGIDITVTTLALAGINQPDWMEGGDLFALEYEPREYVISARDRCDYTIDRVRAVTTERYKYIRNFLTDRPYMQPQYRDAWPEVEAARELHAHGQLTPVQDLFWSDERVPEELYDLESDPHEINNLAQDPVCKAILERHRQILTAWIAETDDQGQYPESLESLRGVLQRWRKEAVNPEFDKAR